MQSGFPELRIASLFDYELIKKAQQAAEEVIKTDPDLEKYPALKARLGEEMDNEAHLE